MQNNVCDISYAEKVKIFSANYLMCMTYIERSNDDPRHVFTRMVFSKLISSAHALEDFLDFNGAKNNKNWYYYRELSAAVRHISLAANSLKHIAIRLGFYELGDTENFEADGDDAFLFLVQTLQKLAPAILEEANRLEIPVPDGTFFSSEFPGISSNKLLEYDMADDFGQEERERQKRNIVKLASEFLGIARYFDRHAFFEPYSIEEIIKIVPDTINEVEIRKYQMLVHNLQSYFDTYVVHGGYGSREKKLKQFRSLFSVVFHLLKMMGRLLHFYERHLLDVGFRDINKQVRERLASIIDPNKLIRYTVNYGLYYVCHFLSTGKEPVKEILNENIEQASIRVNVPVTRGFHSRPSLLVAKIVQHFGGRVDLCVGDEKFDAGSVLDIQYAGGMIQHEKITEVEFRGDVRALNDIEKLAASNYGEDSVGKGVPLPDDLKYLRQN